MRPCPLAPRAQSAATPPAPLAPASPAPPARSRPVSARSFQVPFRLFAVCLVGSGQFRLGRAVPGTEGCEWPVRGSCGLVVGGVGSAVVGFFGVARIDPWPGLAWRGVAWLGLAWRGLAWWECRSLYTFFCVICKRFDRGKRVRRFTLTGCLVLVRNNLGVPGLCRRPGCFRDRDARVDVCHTDAR